MWAQYRKSIGRRRIAPCRFYIYDDMRSAVTMSQIPPLPQHHAAERDPLAPSEIGA